MKDPRKGKQIKTLDQLKSLALKGGSVCTDRVWVQGFGFRDRISSHTPAAFMLNRIGSDLHRILGQGLFEYKAPKKAKGIRKGFK